jgi:hypothetical protein
MKFGSCTLRKGFVGGLAFLVLLAAAPNGYAAAARPIKYKGSGSDTFVTAFFTYDGGSAMVATASGKDNLGGAFIEQCVSEVAATAGTCTAPDGSAGTLYNLVQSDCAGTYTGGLYQGTGIYSTSTVGTDCSSNTSGSHGGSSTYTVTGGSGKLVGASGTAITTYTGVTLAAPQSPGGGFFGAQQFSSTGSVTK